VWRRSVKSKTSFQWVKVSNTCGHYTRANAEIVLLFTKGKPLKRACNNIQQVLISRRGIHSVKPPEIRDRIVRLFGDIPRIELFARSREGFFPDYEYAGWDVFGNEVNYSTTLFAKDL
jgi:N6-adenosine-specific RNA methylase IME4